MGILQHLNRGKKDSHVAHDIAQTDASPADKEVNVAYATGTDADNLSLEARDEKEVQAHPDQVTADAQTGVQKAEATALVWPNWALYSVYAW